MVKTMNNNDLLKLILKLVNVEENNFEEKTTIEENNFEEKTTIEENNFEEKTTIEDFLLNKYVIVRTYSAGVFAGTLQRRVGTEVVLTNARRFWEWDGAASLSQLAEEGSSKPENCKFPCEVKEVLLLGVIEIIKVSKSAEENIKSIPIWKE